MMGRRARDSLAECAANAVNFDLVEPPSLDAYLDVTENKTGLPPATRVASTIRAQIRQELNLIASGRRSAEHVSGEARIDWRKPNGLSRLTAALSSRDRAGRIDGKRRHLFRSFSQLALNGGFTQVPACVERLPLYAFSSAYA
jgi:hypothetical protein